jgi:hypothetical protein
LPAVAQPGEEAAGAGRRGRAARRRRVGRRGGARRVGPVGHAGLYCRPPHGAAPAAGRATAGSTKAASQARRAGVGRRPASGRARLGCGRDGPGLALKPLLPGRPHRAAADAGAQHLNDRRRPCATTACTTRTCTIRA